MGKFYVLFFIAIFLFGTIGCKQRKELRAGLKSVMVPCNSQQLKTMHIFVKMIGQDSVFRTFPVQLRVNNNYGYLCERGAFENPAITCQVIDCDGKTVAKLFYHNKRSQQDSKAVDEIEILK